MNTDRSRLHRRLFYCLITLALSICAYAGPPATTTVSDTVYRADGSPASGTLLITWPAFTAADLIEYHWLTDTNPRVFQLGLPGSLQQQMVVVKFGAVVVKGSSYAHYKVNVTR